MRLPDATLAVVSALRLREESKNFLVRFSLRNPPVGYASEGCGALGVSSRNLIDRYVAALERLYDTLTSGPLNWAKRPVTDTSCKTEVYVLHLPSVGMIEPFTAVDSSYVPYICLPCRSSEPRHQEAFQRAEVEAVHEAAHVFCWSARPPKGLIETGWFWFAEATAVFLEGYVFPGNLDAIRFAMDWVDFPDWPLDEPRACYQSGFFARYLAQRFGPELIARMWNESLPEEGPFEALNRMVPVENQSTPSVMCHVFGDYSHDSYFLWDHHCDEFHNEVFFRFGSRALTQTFILAPGEQRSAEWSLDHLACRYFRIEVSSAVRRLETAVTVKAGGESFRCFLSVHRREHQRGVWKELDSQVRKASARGETKAALSGKELEDCDWVLLTVANCGVRSKDTEPLGKPHDDRMRFTIRIKASL